MLSHNYSVLADHSFAMAGSPMPDGGPALPPHVRIGGGIDALGGVRSPEVNLALWERSSPVGAIDPQLLDTVDDLAIVRPVDRLATMIPDDLATSGYPAALAASLGDDIALLAGVFAEIVGAARVSIRLDVVETDACHRFHADYVTARLICTYVGPGTQWLDAGDAAALGEGAAVDGLTIRSLSTGHVGVFKGRLWSPDAPIVHRSPPILTTGERRLLLVIDPAPDATRP